MAAAPRSSAIRLSRPDAPPVRRQPDDIDARSFYALATLGLAHEGRDTALYMDSAALLEEAFPAYSTIPACCILIDSYDDPVMPRSASGLLLAYAKVADDAGHAQHMISHIYLAMGRWEEVGARQRHCGRGRR